MDIKIEFKRYIPGVLKLNKLNSEIYYKLGGDVIS